MKGISFNEFVKRINPSPIAYTAYQGEWFMFGDLPDIPKGFFLATAKIDLYDDDISKKVLDSLKIENKRIDTMDENNKEYEDACFFVQLQFSELMDHYFGKQPIIEDKIYLVDLMVMTFWDYLDDKISYNGLLKKLKKYNAEYIS